MSYQSNISDTVRFHVLEAEDAPARLLRGYHDGFEEAFLRAAENFTWFDASNISGPDKVLAVAVEDDRVTAGFYFERTHEGDLPVPYIKGLFSNSTTRGLSPELIKLALFYERAHQSKAIGALATIRIQADDVVNPAVARVFGRLGFFPRTRGVFKATPCARLRHLVPTANRFEDGKPVFEVLHMALTPADASRLVADVA